MQLWHLQPMGDVVRVGASVMACVVPSMDGQAAAVIVEGPSSFFHYSGGAYCVHRVVCVETCH